MKVYLDNAATTPLDKDVFAEMLPYLEEHFGNPSSTHSHGRQTRAAIEKSRKTIAKLLNASPSEIFFTSGGTEADNTALRGLVQTYSLEHVITSPLEHHAVLHTLEELEHQGLIKLHFLPHNAQGELDLIHLRELLANLPKCLVSLMHGNNEIGNLLDLERVGTLCQEFGAYFHSDTVQTVGHFPIDVKKIKVHAIVGSAHKFHGPKGIGFLYLRKDTHLPAFITGGAQERNMRGGTENVYGIVGMAKALEIACGQMEAHRQHLQQLKSLLIKGLEYHFPAVAFNGCSADVQNSLYTVLNVSFAPSRVNDMLLFSLDLHGISASGGSACSSGAAVGSHVLAALGMDANRATVRFSFSKYNKVEEIDYLIEKLKEILLGDEVKA